MTTSNSHLLRITLLSSVAALGGFLFGYDSGVINGTIGALREAFDTDAVGSGFNVVSAFYASKFVRETMGRSLEQMEL